MKSDKGLWELAQIVFSEWYNDCRTMATTKVAPADRTRLMEGMVKAFGILQAAQDEPSRKCFFCRLREAFRK